jgi:RNase H-fold protein (predicted Holliday junction resolvase)
MPRQQVEFEFPDPDKDENTQEIEVDTVEEDAPLEVEGAVGREYMKSAKDKDTIKAGDVEIEVEDDTPQKLIVGRKAAAPPQEVTDEELENYSEKVKSRIKHFSKGYHDERRAKETALREREALEAYAKQLVEENQRLTGTVSKSQSSAT